MISHTIPSNTVRLEYVPTPIKRVWGTKLIVNYMLVKNIYKLYSCSSQPLPTETVASGGYMAVLDMDMSGWHHSVPHSIIAWSQGLSVKFLACVDIGRSLANTVILHSHQLTSLAANTHT
jgi:hypothetical protein